MITRGLDIALSGLRRLSAGGVWLGGGLLTAYCAAVGAEVLMRRFAGHSLAGLDEIGGYLLAFIAALAFTETLLHRGHIRIDLVQARLPRTGRVVLDLLALAGLIGFFGLLLRYAEALLMRSATMGTRSMTPLAVLQWVPQALWFAGLVLFVATAVVLFLRAALALAAGDLATVQSLAGARSADDDLAEERELNDMAGTRT